MVISERVRCMKDERSENWFLLCEEKAERDFSACWKAFWKLSAIILDCCFASEERGLKFWDCEGEVWKCCRSCLTLFWDNCSLRL